MKNNNLIIQNSNKKVEQLRKQIAGYGFTNVYITIKKEATINTYTCNLTGLFFTNRMFEMIKRKMEIVEGIIEVQFRINLKTGKTKIMMYEQTAFNLALIDTGDIAQINKLTAGQIKALRVNNNIRIVKLGLAAGLSPGYISEVLNENKTLSLETKVRLLDAMKLI